MGKFILTAQVNLKLGSTRPIINDLKKQLSGLTANIEFKVAQGTNQRIRGLNSTLPKLTQNLREVAAAADSANLALSRIGAGRVNLNNLNNVKFIINDITKAASATGRASSDIRNITDAVERFGAQSALAFRRFTAFVLATATFFSFINAVRIGIRETARFQHEMVRLSIITGKTTTELKGISDEVGRLSTKMGTSSADLIKASVTLAQAGFTARQTKIALEALAKTTLAPTFDDITSTTEGAIAALSQFKFPIEELETKLSRLNAVAAAFPVESSDLVTAIQKAGGVFQASGASLEELIALFTSVRSTTRESADTIATAFRTIFGRMQRSSTLDFLRELNIELTEAGKFVGPFEAVRRLNLALKDLPVGDVRKIQIAEELGGIRQLSKVIPLIEQFEKAQQALAVAQAGSNSLAIDQAKAQESLLVKLTKVREEFLRLFRTLGDSAVFKAVVDTTLKLATVFASLAEKVSSVFVVLAGFATFKVFSGIGRFFKGFRENLTGVNTALQSISQTQKQGGVGATVQAVSGNTTVVNANTAAITALKNAVLALIGRLDVGVATLAKSITEFTLAVQALAARTPITSSGGPFPDRRQRAGFGFPKKFARGGTVPGSGQHDSVLSLLTPGEFVVRKDVVRRIGVDKLRELNNTGVAKFADGGIVGSNVGGAHDSIARITGIKAQRKFLQQEARRFGVELKDIADVMRLTKKRIKQVVEQLGWEGSGFTVAALSSRDPATGRPRIELPKVTSAFHAREELVHTLDKVAFDKMGIKSSTIDHASSVPGTLANKLAITVGKRIEANIRRQNLDKSGPGFEEFVKQRSSAPEAFHMLARRLSPQTVMSVLGLSQLKPSVIELARALDTGRKDIPGLGTGKTKSEAARKRLEEHRAQKAQQQLLQQTKSQQTQMVPMMPMVPFQQSRFAPLMTDLPKNVHNEITKILRPVKETVSKTLGSRSVPYLDPRLPLITPQQRPQIIIPPPRRPLSDIISPLDRARDMMAEPPIIKPLFPPDDSFRQTQFVDATDTTKNRLQQDRVRRFGRLRNLVRLRRGLGALTKPPSSVGTQLGLSFAAGFMPTIAESAFGNINEVSPSKRGTAAFGSALGSGAMAGLLATSFINPLVGAGVGIATFVAVLAQENEKIKQLQFAERLEKFSDTLQKVVDGMLPLGRATDDIKTSVTELTAEARRTAPLLSEEGFGPIESIRSIFGADIEKERLETRSQFFGEKRTQLGQFIAIRDRIAEQVGSLEEFEQFGGGAGAQVINILSEFGISLQQARKETAEYIKTAKEVREKQRELGIAVKETVDIMKLSGALTNVVQDAESSMSNFNIRLDALSDSLSGNLPGLAAVSFDKVGRLGETIDVGGLFSQIDAVTSVFGEQGKRVATDAKKFDALSRALPDVLQRFTNIDLLDPAQTTDFFGEFEEVIREAVGDADFANRIRRIAESIDEPADFLKKIRNEGAKNISEQIIDKAGGTNLGQVLDSIGKDFESQFNQINQRILKSVDFQLQIDEKVRQLGEARLEIAKRQAEFAGKELTADELTKPFLDFQDRLVGFTGIGTDPTKISEARRAALEQAEAINREILQKRLENPEDVDGLKALNDKFRDASTRAGRLGIALDNLANSSNLAAGPLAELESLSRERGQLTGFSEQFLFADDLQRQDILGGLQVGLVAALQGSLEGIPGQLRGAALSFLNDFSDVSFGALGGQKLGDRKFDILRNEFDRILPKNLLKGEDREKFLDTLTSQATDKQKTLQQQIIDALSISRDAIQAQVTENELKLGEFITQTNNQFTSFVDQLKKLLDQYLLGEGQRKDILDEAAARRKAEQDAARAQLLAPVAQGGFGLNEHALKNIANVQGDFENIVKLQQSRDLLLRSNFEVFKQGFDQPGGNIPNIDAARDFIAINADAVNKKLSEFGLSREQSERVIGGATKQIFDSVNNLTADQVNAIFDKEIRKIADESHRKSLEEVGKLAKILDTSTLSVSNLVSRFEELQKVLEKIQKIPNPNIAGGEVEGRARGGSIFKRRGTDTVPAMLTPGEFVVNARAAKKNREILESINSGRVLFASHGGLIAGGRLVREKEEAVGGAGGKLDSFSRPTVINERRRRFQEEMQRRRREARNRGFILPPRDFLENYETPINPITGKPLKYNFFRGATGRDPETRARKRSEGLARSQARKEGLKGLAFKKRFEELLPQMYEQELAIASNLSDAELNARRIENINKARRGSGKPKDAPQKPKPSVTIPDPLGGLPVSLPLPEVLPPPGIPELPKPDVKPDVAAPDIPPPKQSPPELPKVQPPQGQSLEELAKELGMSLDDAREYGLKANQGGQFLLNIADGAPGQGGSMKPFSRPTIINERRRRFQEEMQRRTEAARNRGFILPPRDFRENYEIPINPITGKPIYNFFKGARGRSPERYAAKRAEGLVKSRLREQGLKGLDFKKEFDRLLPIVYQEELLKASTTSDAELNAERIKRVMKIRTEQYWKDKLREGGAQGLGFFAKGGMVDTVPAMLTPGEFVLNKDAVKRLGVDNLQFLNKGGLVQYKGKGGFLSKITNFGNDGGKVVSSDSVIKIDPTAQSILKEFNADFNIVVTGFGNHAATLNTAFNTFASNSQNLITALNQFPRQVEITGRQTVEVIVNGAEVLKSINPEIQKMIESKVKQALSAKFRTAFGGEGDVEILK